MNYRVKLTDHAVSQMQEAVWYISKVLLAPDVARKWSSRVKKEIASLDHMPLRYPLVEDEPWRSEGIRMMPVENFLVYYWIDDPQKTVWVTAIVYGRRDQLSVLRNMPTQ